MRIVEDYEVQKAITEDRHTVVRIVHVPRPGCGPLLMGQGTAAFSTGKIFRAGTGIQNSGRSRMARSPDRQPPRIQHKGNTFLIWRLGTVEDFELHLSYRIVGGNSGIQYRSKDLGNWVVGGYQADFEAGKVFSGILYDEKGRGILAKRGEKTTVDASGKVQVTGSVGDSDQLQAAIKNEGWNDYVVIAIGNHLIHKINGHVTVDVTDDQVEKRVASGILALQLHAGPPMLVQFKDIQMKRIKPEGVKRIVLVAGTPSHAPGDHEFNAGVLILKNCLAGLARHSDWSLSQRLAAGSYRI